MIVMMIFNAEFCMITIMFLFLFVVNIGDGLHFIGL